MGRSEILNCASITATYNSVEVTKHASYLVAAVAGCDTRLERVTPLVERVQSVAEYDC
jgi:hypothetical protein